MVSDAQLVALMAALGFDDYPMGTAIQEAVNYLTEAKRQVREAERARARMPHDEARGSRA